MKKGEKRMMKEDDKWGEKDHKRRMKGGKIIIFRKRRHRIKTGE